MPENLTQKPEQFWVNQNAWSLLLTAMIFTSADITLKLRSYLISLNSHH